MDIESIISPVEVVEGDDLSVHAVALRLLPAVISRLPNLTAREHIGEAYRYAEAYVEERDRRVGDVRVGLTVAASIAAGLIVGSDDTSKAGRQSEDDDDPIDDDSIPF